LLAFRGARHFAIESEALLPAEIFTREPSRASPARIISASGSCTLHWITRTFTTAALLEPARLIAR
jgi:hypothetical protein